MKPKIEREKSQLVPDTRESRGPETSHYLEDDTFNISKDKKKSPRRERGDFDDEIVR